MAYDISKLTKLGALQELAKRAEATYAKQTDLDTLSDKVDDLVTTGGEANVLEGVQVNGTALEIVEKVVNILIASGSANGTISVNGVDVTVTGIDEMVATAVADADHLKYTIVTGTDAIDLTADDADQYIYLVSNSDGKSGDSYDEYMVINGALEKVGDWTVDLSDYLKLTGLSVTETGTGNVVTAVSYDNTTGVITVTKGITAVTEDDIATDDEVTEMLDEIYGATE